MAVKKPTLNEVHRIADSYYLDLSDEDARSFLGLMDGLLASYARIDQLVEPKPEVKYPRTAGYRPQPEENRYNAWYYKTSIKGASSGLLAGKTIAIKDNICVAGVPMMNGASVLEGYTPDIDATVVTRMLDAGGEIVGKAVAENLCVSGASHTADTGPILNPHKPTHSTGGSSAGSAALLAAGEVDLSIGGDQGGSVRIPASWSGIYGMKPTHGLVPYTGAFPVDLTLDHLGPMTNSTADMAVMLEAIAGPDGLDPRQYEVKTDNYTQALKGDVKGLKIGVVQEGFGMEGVSEPDVDEAVRKAGAQFEKLGAQVSTISIPMHADGPAIWNGIIVEGVTALMINGNAMGTNWQGYYNVGLMDHYGHSRRERANDLSETTKLIMMTGQYLQERYHGRFYAKAQNLARSLRAAYDAALEQVDLLLMPTTPMKAMPIPPADATREEYVAAALPMVPNTAPFCATGHPSLSVPCGMSDGLPIGMMLTGRHWEESTLLRASHAYEQSVDWKKI